MNRVVSGSSGSSADRVLSRGHHYPLEAARCAASYLLRGAGNREHLAGESDLAGMPQRYRRRPLRKSEANGGRDRDAAEGGLR